MKKIAVVILNWNGVDLLRQFLPSVLQYSEEATIYVVDNASNDDSISVLKSEFPEVQIIENEGNYGFAKGYNEGLQNIKEEYLALVNSDIEVTANWLKPIIHIFEKESEIAIIQPKILDFKNKSYFEYAGAAGGFIDKYGYPFCRGRIFDSVEKDDGQYDSDRKIFWASGACFFIRNKVYQELKGFDEDFFAHQEEIDLCWRAFNLGHVIKYSHQSVVYHIGGATLSVGNPKKTYLNFRNSLYMLTKNLPKDKLFKILFLRMVLDGIAGIQFLIKGKWKHFHSILKAHYQFYINFKHHYRKRNLNNKDNYYAISSIIIRFFIKKQHFYKNLF
ncbi:dTDP-Rha--alpha-D-GlcNAc-pyrophosphate polyprenol alpha-3-L-rhamnosyltransferase [Flavobacterium sp. 9AF]|uniref:glycosyltransferase family 2 protein n=1 Tax=Flavobacterium sp. 9AF TaxID=2653142 RepID=UPI0012EF1B69|nr:glycosyltransferase family 2 protein [Flavobacterium sp. 9AF]VXB85955.1 dTDP-Rha--alpha-D-GlcNAc-pyrophosphate polyprenol alpha-3-L-rhamnosyltransferase [Flavobacterium sp. 9AF]